MQGEIEKMSDHELLAELVRQGRRAERERKIRTWAAAALILAVIVLILVAVPKIMAPIRQLNDSLQQIRETLQQAQGFLDSFDTDSAARFGETMDNLNEASVQLKTLLETLKDSGIENLAGTIEKLGESLDGILRFFRR